MSKESPGTLVMSYNLSMWAIFRDTTMSLQDGRRLYFLCCTKDVQRCTCSFICRVCSSWLVSALMLKVTLGRHKTKQKSQREGDEQKWKLSNNQPGNAVMGTQVSIPLRVFYPVQWAAAMATVLFPYMHFVGTHLNTLLLVPVHEALSANGNLPIRWKHCMYFIGQYLLSI